MKITKILILALILISAGVLTGLLFQQNVWGGIVCYWAVLLAKNYSDWRNFRKDGGKET